VRLAGLAAALLTALLILGAGDRLSRPLFDSWQRLHPRDLSATPVQIVLIDSDSLAAVGPWPWPRYHLARLTEEIASRGAAAIGFDMVFSEPDRVRPDIFAALYPELSPGGADEIRKLKPMDQLFGDVIGKAPVVLGRAGVTEGGGSGRDMPVEAGFSGKIPAGLQAYPSAIGNIVELEHVALGHGLLNGPPDSDGVIRRVPLIAKVSGLPMPGFALELARTGSGAEAIGVSANRISLGERSVAMDAEGRMMLHFGAVPASRISSAADLLRRNFPANAFAGKIVLVGLAAEGSADIVTTPMVAEGYGVLVQAQAVDAILRGGWLARPAWAPVAEWGAGALLALLLIQLLPGRKKGRMMAPVVLAAGIIVTAWFAFDAASLLLDPVRPLLLGGGTAAGLIAAIFVETRHERERLQEDLVRERITAAAAEGELQAARAIQLGMLPPRASLARLDPRIEIDALLEAAKSVGGDFYDAVLLGGDRLGFSIGDVTGKGIPASLFMALSKALAKSVMLREAGDLARAAAMLNDELSRDNEEAMSVTMLIGVIDLSTGAVTMISAGHENPLRIARDGSVSEEALEGGPPFCVVDYPYPAETLTLAAGEALVLVTDGVTEAQDNDGALFGRKRALVAAAAGGHATDITEAVVQAVRKFEAGAEASDDLTILAIRYLGA